MMIQPQEHGDHGQRDAARSGRLARFIREHIAKGNRPDYELAQKKARELDRMASKLEPLGLTEDQIDELALELCRRKGNEA